MARIFNKKYSSSKKSMCTKLSTIRKIKNFKNIISNINYMEKGSGINWHSDAGWKYGATYYINNRWNIQFGGELMFKSEKGHGYLPVVGNSLVLIKSPLDHKVNTVLSSLIPRISIQMFMK